MGNEKNQSVKEKLSNEFNRTQKRIRRKINRFQECRNNVTTELKQWERR